MLNSYQLFLHKFRMLDRMIHIFLQINKSLLNIFRKKMNQCIYRNLLDIQHILTHRNKILQRMIHNYQQIRCMLRMAKRIIRIFLHLQDKNQLYRLCMLKLQSMFHMGLCILSIFHFVNRIHLCIPGMSHLHYKLCSFLQIGMYGIVFLVYLNQRLSNIHLCMLYSHCHLLQCMIYSFQVCMEYKFQLM